MITPASALLTIAPGQPGKGVSTADGDLFALSMLAVGADAPNFAMTAVPPTPSPATPIRQELAAPGMAVPIASIAPFTQPTPAVDPELAWLAAVDIPVPAALGTPAAAVANPKGVAAATVPILPAPDAAATTAPMDTVPARRQAMGASAAATTSVTGLPVAPDLRAPSVRRSGDAQTAQLVAAPEQRATTIPFADVPTAPSAPSSLVTSGDAPVAPSPLTRHGATRQAALPDQTDVIAQPTAKNVDLPERSGDDDRAERDADAPAGDIEAVPPQFATPPVTPQPAIIAAQPAAETPAPPPPAPSPASEAAPRSAAPASRATRVQSASPAVQPQVDTPVVGDAPPAPSADARLDVAARSPSPSVEPRRARTAPPVVVPAPEAPAQPPVVASAAAPVRTQPSPPLSEEATTAAIRRSIDRRTTAPTAEAQRGAGSIVTRGNDQAVTIPVAAATPTQIAPSPVPAQADTTQAVSTPTVVAVPSATGAASMTDAAKAAGTPAAVTEPAPAPVSTPAPAAAPAVTSAASAPLIAAVAPVAVAGAPVIAAAAAPIASATPAIAAPATTAAPTAPSPRAFVREVEGHRQTVTLRPKTELPQPAAGTTAPAAQVFGAAIQAVGRDERRAADPAELTPALAAATGAAPVTSAAPVAPDAQPTLDLRQTGWPNAMIDHIESLRDAANAQDTRIRLVPDALGVIDIAVKTVGDALHVRFTADDATTRSLIEEAQPRLAAIAEERGLHIGRSVVEATPGSQSAGNGANQTPSQTPSQGQTAGQSSQQPNASAAQQAQTNQQQQQQRQPHAPRQPTAPARAPSPDRDAVDDGRLA